MHLSSIERNSKTASYRAILSEIWGFGKLLAHVCMIWNTFDTVTDNIIFERFIVFVLKFVCGTYMECFNYRSDPVVKKSVKGHEIFAWY